MKSSRIGFALSLCAAMVLLGAGCQSPYHADQGALAGGLGGAGVGALVGSAVGKTGPGALIGAGVGALSGAAVGGALDDIEARNRAEIEARIGHPVAAGAVSIGDIVAMSRAGVNEEIIINHVRAHGMQTVLQANDLIALQQQGVSPRVVEAMQAPPMVAAPPPGPVLVEAPPPPYYYYGGPPYPYYRRWGPPRTAVGVTFVR